jgi:hypothetical protein
MLLPPMYDLLFRVQVCLCTLASCSCNPLCTELGTRTITRVIHLAHFFFLPVVRPLVIVTPLRSVRVLLCMDRRLSCGRMRRVAMLGATVLLTSLALMLGERW